MEEGRALWLIQGNFYDFDYLVVKDVVVLIVSAEAEQSREKL